MGADGWSFNDVLPYFLKSEDPQLGMGSKYHSTGGPLTVSRGVGREGSKGSDEPPFKLDFKKYSFCYFNTNNIKHYNF